MDRVFTLKNNLDRRRSAGVGDAHLTKFQPASSSDVLDPLAHHPALVINGKADQPAQADRFQKPFFAGPLRLIDYFERGSAGIGAKFCFIEMPPGAPHPFRGVKPGASNGQRLRTFICTDDDECGPGGSPIYKGEAIVAWWQEDWKGMFISLRLDDGPDGCDGVNPFSSLPIDQSASPGKQVTFACWLIADDETVIVKQAKAPFRGLSGTRQSQILSHDEDFQVFCRRFADIIGLAIDPGLPGEEVAKAVIYDYCDVTSRKDLTSNAAANRRWQELVTRFRQLA